MSEYAVESQGLGKRFGERWAVRDVALRAPAGGIARLASERAGNRIVDDLRRRLLGRRGPGDEREGEDDELPHRISRRSRP